MGSFLAINAQSAWDLFKKIKGSIAFNIKTHPQHLGSIYVHLGTYCVGHF